MPTYTYSIYDSDPAVSSVDAWPDHDQAMIEADDDAEAIEIVRYELVVCAAGSLADGDHKVGDVLYAVVEDADDMIVGTPTHTLTVEDLGVDARDVEQWDTEDAYVADDGDGGAYDVSVQVGEAGGVWWTRTDDDSDSHDYSGPYHTEDDARAAATRIAEVRR